MRPKSGGLSSATTRFTDEIITEAESLVRLWDRAEDWAVPRIPPSQVKVLWLIRFRGEMNLSSLADEIGAIPSSASRLCDRLEASGLVRREVPSDNRREVRLRLTNEGRRRLESFDAARRGALLPVLEGMSPTSRDALVKGLREFSIAAQEVGEATG